MAFDYLEYSVKQDALVGIKIKSSSPRKKNGTGFKIAWIHPWRDVAACLFNATAEEPVLAEVMVMMMMMIPQGFTPAVSAIGFDSCLACVLGVHVFAPKVNASAPMLRSVTAPMIVP